VQRQAKPITPSIFGLTAATPNYPPPGAHNELKWFPNLWRSILVLIEFPCWLYSAFQPRFPKA
jgi:hypothetical protein